MSISRRQFVQSAFVAPLLLATQYGCKADHLKIAIHPWIGYETLYLAEETKRLPASIELIKYNNTTDKIAALEQGVLSGAALTLDEVITLNRMGIPLTTVAIMNISNGADVILTRPGKTKINAGDRIGFEENFVGQVMLELVLKHYQLSYDQVNLFPITVGDNQFEAWQRNKVDALITYEPHASKLKRHGAQVACSSRDVPHRIFDVLAIRDDVLNTQTDNIKELLKLHFNMVARASQHYDDALYRIASRQGITYAEAKHALHGIIIPTISQNHVLLDAQNATMQETFDLLTNIAPRFMPIQQDKSLDQLITNRFLPNTL